MKEAYRAPEGPDAARRDRSAAFPSEIIIANFHDSVHPGNRRMRAAVRANLFSRPRAGRKGAVPMKKRIWANLNSIDRVKAFIAMTNQLSCEIDVCSGRYVVDGKSIMGLFSIDLSVPVELVVHGTPEEVADFEEKSLPFQVERES